MYARYWSERTAVARLILQQDVFKREVVDSHEARRALDILKRALKTAARAKTKEEGKAATAASDDR